MDGLRHETTKQLQKMQDFFNSESQHPVYRSNDNQMVLDNMLKVSRSLIDDRTSEILKIVADIKSDFNLERKYRSQDKELILEELARECMAREKDESAILSTLDQVMRQIKQMNSDANAKVAYHLNS